MADWRLVYAANADGVRTAGSLDELHLAASRGGDIKVGSSSGADSGFGSSIRYCPSVTAWIGDEDRKMVTATCADAVATALLPGRVALAVSGPLFLDYHVYNSNGVHSFARLDVQAGTVDTEFFQTMAMTWYARDYTRPPRPWLADIVGSVVGLFRRES